MTIVSAADYPIWEFSTCSHPNTNFGNQTTILTLGLDYSSIWGQGIYGALMHMVKGPDPHPCPQDIVYVHLTIKHSPKFPLELSSFPFVFPCFPRILHLQPRSIDFNIPLVFTRLERALPGPSKYQWVISGYRCVEVQLQ